eukprot:15070219-Alexandrium_andersonii.AAC.1
MCRPGPAAWWAETRAIAPSGAPWRTQTEIDASVWRRAAAQYRSDRSWPRPCASPLVVADRRPAST